MTKKRLRIKKKKPFFQKPVFWILFFVILISVTAFYIFFFSNIFKIKEVHILGEIGIYKEEIEKFLKKMVGGKNIFLIKSDTIKKETLKNFPQISFLEFKRKFPSGLIFTILERKEVAVFCQKDCYFIDQEGIAFERGEKEGILRIEKENFENEIRLGKQIVDKEFLEKILEILEKSGSKINKVLIVAEDHLQFQTLEGWKFYIDPQKDINWQLIKLKVAIENAIPKEKIQDLEYIDLRFGNFAYPKYKK